MTDADQLARYIKKYPPRPEEPRTMTTKTTLSRGLLDRAQRELAAQKGMDLSQIIEAVKRAGRIDGRTQFPSLQAEAVALSEVAEYPELYLTSMSDEDAAQAVAAIVGGNPDLRWDFAKVGKALNPAAYTDPTPPEVQVQMTAATPEQDAEIVRLSSPELLDFTQPPEYGTAKLISRKQHRNSVALTPETPAEAVIRLTDEADQIAHGGFIGLARKQQAKQHCEHDDHDHGTAAQNLDVDVEIARYSAMAQAHRTTHGNVPGHSAPPGEPGQFSKGPWHSSHAPLRKPGKTPRSGRRAPTWTPGNAAAGMGGDLDAGGGSSQ